MRRILIGSLCLLVLMATPARPQRVGLGRSQFIAAGSTPQGDYLRGLGIAAAGLGSFNLDTARANVLNTQAAIQLDQYVQTVLRQGRDNWAKIDRQTQEKLKTNYEKIKERIREHPEGLDVMTGNALNAVLEELNSPSIQESSYRSAPVAVPREMLRRIPFKLDEKGVIFSLQRLTARGKAKWPIAFQDDKYTSECKAFNQAIDRALDQMIDGKIAPETIAAYEAAVKDLSDKLEREFAPKMDRRYQEARSRLNEMGKASNLLKTLKIQPVMADLDHYSGKTVNDLRVFMQNHGLRFAPAETAEERRVYVDLYAALVEVRNIVADPGKGRNR